MAVIDDTLAKVDGELQRYSVPLAAEFRKAAEATQPHLRPGEVEQWAAEGLAIAQNSFRSWEAAMDYFKASPAVVQKLDFPALVEWAKVGRDLSALSATVASSFFSSSPDALDFIPAREISTWVDLGRRLYKESWKSGLLCGQFYVASPDLFQQLTLPELGSFVEFLEVLARLSFDSATQCLSAGQRTFTLVERSDRDSFVKLAIDLARRNWKVAKTYFCDGPTPLAIVDAQHRPAFFAMTNAVAQHSREDALSFFMESPPHLAGMDRELQGTVLRLAEKVLKLSASAAAGFLKSCPILLKRLSSKEIGEWVGMGLSVLEDNAEAGVAFFKLNSTRASAALQRVSRGAELGEVRDVLQVYCKGLTGRRLSLLSSEDLVDKGIGWTSVETATTEGNAIFLPPYLDEFETKAHNWEAYKVLVTHQAAHLEFCTFDFLFERPSGFGHDLRPEIEAALSTGQPTITDFERFFDLFKDRRLARDIFSVLEDARIDWRVWAEYRGIRRGYSRFQRHALDKRPTIASLPLRQGLLEFLIQASLDASRPFSVPDSFVEQFADAAIVLKRLQSLGVTVEDTAEATLRAYNILRGVPNVLLFEDYLYALKIDEMGDTIAPLSADEFIATDINADLSGDGMMYASPDGVDYRGELKPELVQTMMKLRKSGRKEDLEGGFPISLELLKELMAKSVDIEVLDLAHGDLDSTSGLFITNLMKEHGRMKVSRSTKSKGKKRPKENADDFEDMEEDSEEEVSYFYDEWDFRASDYRPAWCRLRERRLPEGTIDFFDNTLKEHAGLANDVRRQFEMLKPEQFKKLKQLQDGEEFDLDRVIEAVVEKRAGRTPSDKIYWRKNKVERDIVVALLLDMSASTDEEIKEPERGDVDTWYDEWLEKRRLGFAGPPPSVNREPGKRIIDVEKESIVLLIKALEAIGDGYGIYGFSGYGRDNVEFFVVKELDEEFTDRTKRRIDKITPVRGTRMGPAIRHCISKLEKTEAKLRLLILLSDGRPQDHDYGKDRTEKEYAIHDTRMALLEAKRKNIVPFCLTVDKDGQDYLKTMMGDMGYEVVNDVESLPKRLPNLYKRLTT